MKSNREYWIEKIEENISRDKQKDAMLKQMGWVPIHFWEKEVKKDLDNCVNKVIDVMQLQFAKNIKL